MDPAVIDPDRWAVILELVGDDTEVLHELVRLFVTDVPTQLSQLRASVTAGDGEAAAATSHRIAGSATNVGATELGELAYGIEQLSLRGAFESLEPLVDGAARAFQRAAEALAHLSEAP